MMDKFIDFLKRKKWIIVGIIIGILIIILIYQFMGKKNYKVFLDMYMPNDSYGYIVYSPGNNSEFNLYKDSYLNVEYSFSDKVNRDITYVIENEDVVSIDNNKLVAKNNGTTEIYIKTKDNIESNVIIVNVVDKNE